MCIQGRIQGQFRGGNIIRGGTAPQEMCRWRKKFRVFYMLQENVFVYVFGNDKR